MGPAALALAALEVAVARGRAAIPRPQDVRVHPEAHRAARAAPFEACGLEDVVQAFSLGLELDGDAPGNDQGAEPVLHLPAPDDLGRRTEVLDPRVGARTDEDRVGPDVTDRSTGLKGHVRERSLRLRARGDRHRAVDRGGL